MIAVAQRATAAAKAASAKAAAAGKVVSSATTYGRLRDGWDIYCKTKYHGQRGLKKLLRANTDINTPDGVTPAPPFPLPVLTPRGFPAP